MFNTKKPFLVLYFVLNVVAVLSVLSILLMSPSRSIFRFLQDKLPSSQNISLIFIERKISGSSSDCGLLNVPGNTLKALYKEVLYSRNVLSKVNKEASFAKYYDNKAIPSQLTQFQQFVTRLQTSIESSKKENLKQLAKLQSIIQKRIYSLQNSVSCKTARKLICQVQVRCGVGCFFHHIGLCMFVALGSNRSMILNFTKHSFDGIEQVFASVGLHCPYADLSQGEKWQGEKHENATAYDVPIVVMTIPTVPDPETSFAPFTVPAGISERLEFFHEEPNVWWIGQIMKYLTRLRPEVSEKVNQTKENLGFSHPIIGLHIRRTDKYVEAQFYGIEEYMFHAIGWYDQYDKRKKVNSTRKIYVATDNPAIIPDLVNKYPNYSFLYNPVLKKDTMRKMQDKRYTMEGLIDTITDVKILSECDYFVGTFSSNMGRLVHELMQADGDRTFDVFSLDTNFHYVGGHKPRHDAIAEHRPKNGEIELKVGDRMSVDLRKFSVNFGFGFNLRTWKYGAYPMYKVKQTVYPVHYPGLS